MREEALKNRGDAPYCAATEDIKKCGFASLLELAVSVPSSYIDTHLSTSLNVGEVHTFEAEVISAKRVSNRLVAEVKSELADRAVEVTVFNPKPYHSAIFKPGMRHTLQGKIERFGSKLQIVNPKKISQTGLIVPQYRSKLRQDIYRRIVDSLVRVDNLLKEGLDRGRAELIERIHKPDKRWIELYYRYGGFGPKTIEALKFAEAFDYFKRMGAKRKRFDAVKSLAGDISPFLKRLPFELTDDQKRAIDDIKSDLKSGVATRRMVVGDVGSGKTMVMLASVMAAYPQRAILMAPTSILARQLYEEAKKWLPESVDIALVTQSKEVGDLKDAHFIIGTHALLYRELPNAPLVMVDEQHRFGTEQRSALEKMVSSGKKRPHYIQFSATPIPRTQAMIDSALVDISLIESTPFEKDVSTYVIGERDFNRVKEHIAKETQEGRQVLVVYPLVEESEHIGYKSLEQSEDFWKRNFDGVYVTHGKDRRKDEVLAEFAQKGKILLATTVVEVGISLPRLSTIVIVGADLMGLATLHQLRGRVSRTGLKGYCFLFTRNYKSERLKAFANTKNGFEIARLDLKFRKSGDLPDGKVQSGKSFRWIDMAEDERIVKEARERARALLLLKDQ